MQKPASRICLFAFVLGACTSTSQHSSVLDGAVDYQVSDGFIATTTSMHLELDGSATKQVTTRTGPTKMTSGVVTAPMMDALRADIAAVDLAELRADYSCADFPCGTDFPVAMLTISADGSTKQIRVDRGIRDPDLPAGLVTILADLDTILDQLP
jgi:hypothetical protein